MSDQNKDNISQFFRKAVQKPKIKFVESDWEKLEAKLDTAALAASPQHNYWRSAFIAAVALLFVSTALLLYTNHQANMLAAKVKASENEKTASPETEGNKKDEYSNEQPDFVNQGTRTNEAGKNQNRSQSPSLAATNNSGRTSTVKEAFKTRSQNPTSHQNNESIGHSLFNNNDPNNKLLNEQGNPLEKGNNLTISNQPSGLDNASQTAPHDTTKLERKKESEAKAKTSQTDSLLETIKPKPSRWNIMLSIAPDFSATDMEKFSSPGGFIGLTAYYSINNKFSVSAGAAVSDKFYWDDGYEYKINQTNYWAKKTNGIVPDKIEGSCNVLEIPIGLQYYFFNAKKSRLYFASTFSSYIMLKESYQYTFDAPNPGAAQGWNAKKTSYSLFSIANLAIGYERRVSNRLHIGVSPYLKVPMAGIGSWANLKLYSTGASFTLRYQFQKKKKPDRPIPSG